MEKLQDKVEVAVEELRDAAPNAAGDGVVLQTDSRVDGELRDTSIEVSDADAPAVAVALLNSEAPAGDAADLPEAIQCLAVGVLHAANAGRVRLHLQFDSGQVLPIEMPHAAAVALCRGLAQQTGYAA